MRPSHSTVAVGYQRDSFESTDVCDGGSGGEFAGDTAAPNCETLILIP
ncbi:MAG: hypothetical protein AAF467_14005 [Actinomycetota bacterium]